MDQAMLLIVFRLISDICETVKILLYNMFTQGFIALFHNKFCLSPNTARKLIFLKGKTFISGLLINNFFHNPLQD